MSEPSTRPTPDAESTPTGQTWPSFALEYTFNPRETAPDVEFAPDEVVFYDPDAGSTRWMSADRGSFVPVEDVQ